MVIITLEKFKKLIPEQRARHQGSEGGSGKPESEPLSKNQKARRVHPTTVRPLQDLQTRKRCSYPSFQTERLTAEAGPTPAQRPVSITRGLEPIDHKWKISQTREELFELAPIKTNASHEVSGISKKGTKHLKPITGNKSRLVPKSSLEGNEKENEGGNQSGSKFKSLKNAINAQRGSFGKLGRKARSQKKKRGKRKGFKIQVVKVEMNSVSKRADYMCSVSLCGKVLSTKVHFAFRILNLSRKMFFENYLNYVFI